jgi:hypothetical protein
VLDIRFMDSKSSSAMAWSNKTDFKCPGVFKENATYPSPEIPSDVKLVEKSFERNMNLNSQSLSVFGLHILLLKVAGLMCSWGCDFGPVRSARL